MEIVFTDGAFICRCPYELRDIPRDAGFSWDRLDRKWYTTIPRIAARLRQYASGRARDEINRIMLDVRPWSSAIPYPEHKTPMAFQIEAAHFALSRNRSYLALSPGLGKTVVAALIANALAKQEIFTYYVCPPGLQDTCENILREWLCAPFIAVITDSKIHRANTQEMILKTPGKIALIVDEAHRFKNPLALRTKAMLTKTDIHKRAVKTILMSGTPMPNRPIELYPVLSTQAPETIGFKSHHQYGVRYCNAFQKENPYSDKPFGWDYSGASNLTELFKNVKDKYMLRVKKEEVLKQLPPKTESLLLIGATPAKIRPIERKILKEWIPDNLVGEVPPGPIATYRKELGLTKVRPAIKYLKEFLESHETESIVVFAFHKEVIANLTRELSTYRPLVITGDTPTSERAKIEKEFQTVISARLLIANYQAGGVGFTFTKATRAIFVEFSWVPGDNEQASDRIHRIGQHKNTYAQYMVFKDSLDRQVLETMLRKRQNINKL